jgi:hypothetical protein
MAHSTSQLAMVFGYLHGLCQMLGAHQLQSLIFQQSNKQTVTGWLSLSSNHAVTEIVTRTEDLLAQRHDAVTPEVMFPTWKQHLPHLGEIPMYVRRYFATTEHVQPKQRTHVPPYLRTVDAGSRLPHSGANRLVDCRATSVRAGELDGSAGSTAAIETSQSSSQGKIAYSLAFTGVLTAATLGGEYGAYCSSSQAFTPEKARQ